MTSLTEKQLHTLEKIGDLFCPGTSTLPKFSTIGCAHEIDRILNFMPEGDLKDLKLLFGLLSFLPSPLLRISFIKIRFLAWALPGILGAPFRQIQMGMRGLVFSLYYSSPKILERLEYKVSAKK